MTSTDTVAVVTGAARGLGATFAEHLAGTGATLVLADRDEAGLGATATRIERGGGTARVCPLDLGAEPAVERLRGAVDTAGGVDVLVACAGAYDGLGQGDPVAIDPDELDRVLTVDVAGTWRAVRACVPSMRRRGGGRIVTLASVAAWGSATMPHYGTAKAAVVGFTRSLARYLGGEGIVVNALAPGPVTTEAARRAIDASRWRRLRSVQAVDRLGEPSDLLGALALLTGPGAAFLTGQVLVVDGGTLCR